MNFVSMRRAFAILAIAISVLSVTGGFNRSNPSTYFSVHAQSGPGRSRSTPRAKKHGTVRFDNLVRDDFFAGMMGDAARLDRGMKYCEKILARNPKHADALVWHGGGLLARAAQAYRKGDLALGDTLWIRGLEEMNGAVAYEPNNLAVKIGRSATLVGLAQSGWSEADAEAKKLLRSAVEDYEKVYQWQKPFFRKLGIHSRGELLFGLASGWSILGDQDKARDYLRLITEECSGTDYEQEARRWLATNSLTVQHDCVGCHIK